jgi:hypothetical protein
MLLSSLIPWFIGSLIHLSIHEVCIEYFHVPHIVVGARSTVVSKTAFALKNKAWYRSRGG